MTGSLRQAEALQELVNHLQRTWSRGTILHRYHHYPRWISQLRQSLTMMKIQVIFLRINNNMNNKTSLL